MGEGGWGMITLYDDQREQVEAVRESMGRGNKRVLMQACTGAGKTVMAAAILQGAGQKGSSTWFVAPRRELIRQTALTYQNFGIRYEIIAAGHRQDRAQNQICSLQTLPRRLDKLTAPDLCIVDETHYGGAGLDALIEWLGQRGSWIIGLSATPVKQNGQGMDKWYDDLVLGTPMKELIRLGRLSQFRMFAPATPDLKGVKVTAGDYNKKSLQNWMDEHGKWLIGNAVKTYKDNAMGMLGLTYASSIKESQRIAEMFGSEGVPAAHLDGTMGDDVRKALIEKFANRELLQLVSVDLMTFGFDLAAQVGRDVTIECMSDLRPTKSVALQLQKWGRVLRAKDKPALIFDHAGNAMEHGMPDEDREWTLKGRDKKRRKTVEREVEMRQCEKCWFCHEPAPKCPNCGYVYPVQGRTIDEVEGELVEVEAIERKHKRMEVGRARTRAELERIAKERGYAPGWVWKQMQVKGIR